MGTERQLHPLKIDQEHFCAGLNHGKGKKGKVEVGKYMNSSFPEKNPASMTGQDIVLPN
jgi:hypothetical protein